jgi:NADPH:quinone reductase-like Zn-dependent oxidoreductase
MTNIPDHGLQLRSKITGEGQLVLSLDEVPVRPPGPDEVVVRIEAAPVNPSDSAPLIGAADLARAKLEGSGASTRLTAPLLPGALERLAGRVGQSLPAGLEGAGVVVVAGDQARALMGRTVAVMGGSMYAQYITVKAEDCLLLPEDATPKDGASCFVNPLTALAMVEAMRLEGYTALVHTAAASNLGQMLVRICRADEVPLVNIVRRPEQVELLRGIGAEYVCDSSAPDFRLSLIAALKATGATLAFDAIAGGTIIGEILHCMEIAHLGPGYTPYGTTVHKQVYMYGMLDLAPTQLPHNFGMHFGIGGFLLRPFLERAGKDVADRLRARVAAELKTTFVSHYTAEVSLAQLLDPGVLAEASRRSTGGKFLVNTSRL